MANAIIGVVIETGVDRPAIVPDRTGLQLEWHRGGADIEIIIDKDGKTSLWYDGPSFLALVIAAVKADCPS